MGRRKVDADWKLASSGWGGGERREVSPGDDVTRKLWAGQHLDHLHLLSRSLSEPDHTEAQRQWKRARKLLRMLKVGITCRLCTPLKRHWNHTGERGEQGVGL